LPFDPFHFDRQTWKLLQQQAEMLHRQSENMLVIQKDADIVFAVSKQLQDAARFAPSAKEMAAFARQIQLFNIQPINAYVEEIQSHLEKEPDEQEVLVQGEIDILLPDTKVHIVRYSPSLPILEKILQGNIDLDSLGWREFEELVADLLSKDGYHVELGPGRKDEGVDIMAVKEVEGIGLVMAVWQAKKLALKNKVGIEVIRELADTCNETQASKGVIVTTTFLTGPAIKRVQRDKYKLSKVDRDDLMQWMRRVKQQG
jgi:restriction endonuclease Mrr